MREEEIIYTLIKRDFESRGKMKVSRLMKMVSLLNIHPERCQKVVEQLIQDKKISKSGYAFVLA